MSKRGARGKAPKSAAALMDALQRGPDFVAREQQREADAQRNLDAYRIAAAGLRADLAAVGFDVEAVRELRLLGRPYPEAVPVLIHWLPLVKYDALKEDIVRTLSVPWARDATSLLLDEFMRADDATETGLRWAIGAAIEVHATDAIANEMIKLATDRRYGRAREMIVVGLGKLRDARAEDVALRLLGDDEVLGHAIRALGKLRARSARAQIEGLLHDPRSWIRKEAKRALACIDGY